MADTTEQSGLALQQIAVAYSRLAPLFAHLRRQREFRGNTLIPNALSPIAPAMAYGHCGDLPHGLARERLQEHPDWEDASSVIRAAYDNYRKASGNALLWAGWNYWDPTAASSANRVIQVVLSEDFSELDDSLLDDQRTLLEHDGEVLLRLGDLTEPPVSDSDAEVILGNELSRDSHLVGESLRRPRILLHNLWSQIFVPSAQHFADPGEATIVDHLFHDYRRQLDNPEIPGRAVIPEIAALFGEDATETAPSPDRLRLYRVRSEWTAALWQLVSRVAAEERRGRGAEIDSPAEDVVQAWKTIADDPDLLGATAMGQALAELRAVVPSIRSEREAYVILQHLALFERFLASNCQYIFPIVFGRHLFVAFCAFRHPLQADELRGWRQVITSLFGGLLVELLSRSAETLRRRAAQRFVLAHALPKSVFKPAEYFAVKLRTALSAIADGAKGPARGALAHAELLQLLLQKGQAETASFAQADGDDEGGREVTDLHDVCNQISNYADSLKEFFIAGHVDRVLLANGGAARDVALEKTRIEVTADPGDTTVLGNSGVLFLHLWNVVDNSFRHGGVTAQGTVVRFSITRGDDELVLAVTNSGTNVDTDTCSLLNELFDGTTRPPRFDEIQRTLESSSRTPGLTTMEDERRGTGLFRFNEYLRSRWDAAEDPEHRRGRVRATGGGTRFEFCFPSIS